ncbi:RNA degradosome polyphosphate kinase [Johnsonella ignava]|uniref:RNA degradosome polyphosphate kinase n=1 Tax=Johnsonella ignava TaxID=43995 RepID=UPI0023F3C586|nr:RNA degradosome polyphosphate kinase [Johnsonella ignava]
MAEKKSYKKTENKSDNKSVNYVNRELSWLEFNKRVLGEARDKEIKLFERLKFLAITASNLDEFYMVRVASLKDMLHAGYMKPDISGMTPEKQLSRIADATHEFVDMQYSTYKRSLLPRLEKAGLRIIENYEELDENEAQFIDKYFADNVYPVLTPMAVDSSRPFPLIRNKTLNIAALVKRREDVKPFVGFANIDKAQKENVNRENYSDERDNKKNQSKKNSHNVNYKGYAGDGLDFAVVQVPGVLPRVVEIPEKYAAKKPGIKKTIILLEEIIEKNLDNLFLNYNIISAHPFRIMRNAEFELDEEDAADLLEEIKKQLKKRQWGEAIRLEAEEGMDKRLLKILKDELDIDNEDLFKINGPLDLTVLMKVYALCGFEKYKLEAFTPRANPRFENDDNIFENIKKGDVLLSHPYQSFEPVIDFVKEAAKDPKVLAIKQTLYRVSGNSPIIAALAKAADNGKQVTVLVELKARFDEENNILWAKKLEQAGCHVIYGLVGLKTHSKITLVLRKEDEGIMRYVHLGTGNYNDTTAKIYTDLGMFTCRSDYGEDANAVFNMLSGYSEPLSWNKLIVAPLWMKDKFLHKIKLAESVARKGNNACIIAKMNSLSDKDIIKALYAASCAGVRIELIVRGICCLRAGIEGLSSNIRVHSIVGNFLEHARIFYFNLDTEEEYYLGSADWMTRNLEKRIEIVFPVVDEELKLKLKHYLKTELEDNVKAYIYMPDGSYEKQDLRGKVRVNSQQIFINESIEEEIRVKKHRDGMKDERMFTPLEGGAQ